MKLFHRPLIYIQVYCDHFKARVVGQSGTIRRDCHALDNRRSSVKDFTTAREALRSIVNELAPGFTLRRPVALMHFIPEQYLPSQNELEHFKETAERSGVSFCWLSTWETAHADDELHEIRGAL